MTNQRRPTMRDVAETAGVSFKTVSRVVNGEGGVSAPLVSRVEAAVVALDYRPDHRARYLRQSQSQHDTIGLVLGDVANPFFGNILRGIEEVAAERDCLVLSGSTDASPDRERQLVETFVGRRVSGLIVAPSRSGTDALKSEIGRGTPIVFCDLDPHVPGIDLVRSDHYFGSFMAVRHLQQAGHTDIAYYGDDTGIFSANERLRGFNEAMVQAGLHVETDRVHSGAHDGDEWRSIIESQLRSPGRPTAIFTAQNFVTMAGVRALHALGLQHEVAQVGFDDFDLADALDPSVTVVPQQPRLMGRRAAELLFDRIDGVERSVVHEIIESRLIQRGSGEIPPAA